MGRSKKPKLPPAYNWHHRKPRVHGGSSRLSSGNMIEVRVDHHRAFHMLFQASTVPQIAAILNETWIDPEWELIARKRT